MSKRLDLRLQVSEKYQNLALDRQLQFQLGSSWEPRFEQLASIGAAQSSSGYKVAEANLPPLTL